MNLPLGARTFAWIIVVGSSLGASDIADAQGSDAQQKLIRNLVDIFPHFAGETCNNVSQSSESSVKDLHGGVKAQLDGLFSKLADVGFTAGGNITTNETKGVLQTDLAAVLMHSEDCKLEVLKLLVNTLLPSEPFPPSSSGAPPPGVTAPSGPASPPENGAPKSAASMSCDELWYQRNAIYARKGYCFKTQRAIETFGKSCFPPYGVLQGSDQNRVTEISIWEKQKGC